MYVVCVFVCLCVHRDPVRTELRDVLHCSVIGSLDLCNDMEGKRQHSPLVTGQRGDRGSVWKWKSDVKGSGGKGVHFLPAPLGQIECLLDISGRIFLPCSSSVPHH